MYQSPYDKAETFELRWEKQTGLIFLLLVCFLVYGQLIIKVPSKVKFSCGWNIKFLKLSFLGNQEGTRGSLEMLRWVYLTYMDTLQLARAIIIACFFFGVFNQVTTASNVLLSFLSTKAASPSYCLPLRSAPALHFKRITTTICKQAQAFVFFF